MKLSEIKRNLSHETVEIESEAYGPMRVEVAFSYTPSGSTQHEPSDPTTREYHSSEIDIDSIKTEDEVEEFNEEGDPTGKKWPKGTDVTKLPNWTKSDDQQVMKELEKLEGQDDDDFDEPNAYYRRYI